MDLSIPLYSIIVFLNFLSNPIRTQPTLSGFTFVPQSEYDWCRILKFTSTQPLQVFFLTCIQVDSKFYLIYNKFNHASFIKLSGSLVATIATEFKLQLLTREMILLLLGHQLCYNWVQLIKYEKNNDHIPLNKEVKVIKREHYWTI